MAKKSKSTPKRKPTPARKSASPKTKKKVVVSTQDTSKVRASETATVKTSKAISAAAQAKAEQLPFSRMNYILLAIGVGLIVLGFILMSLEDFVDASEFSIALYIAPILVVGGFVEIIFAIMYKAKSADSLALDQET